MRFRSRVLIPWSKKLTTAEPSTKVGNRKDQYAILRPADAALQADDDSLLYFGVVLGYCAKTFQMIRGDLRRCFGRDRKLHVVDDKVDLNPAGQTPITELAESLTVCVVRVQLMEGSRSDRLNMYFKLS